MCEECEQNLKRFIITVCVFRYNMAMRYIVTIV